MCFQLIKSKINLLTEKFASHKFRLVINISLILLIVIVVGAIHFLRSARENIKSEIRSAEIFISHILDAEIAYIVSLPNAENVSKPFNLSQLNQARHIKITFFDKYGKISDANYDDFTHSAYSEIPDWFVELLIDSSLPFEKIQREIKVNGSYLGRLVIEADPTSEMQEIWNDFVEVLLLVLIYFLVANFIVYQIAINALKPTEIIWQALNSLERGELNVRLPTFAVPELAKVSEKFNRMASTLQQEIDRNQMLSQQLLRTQEEERKKIASDLHDELGQTLTAIKMDSMTLLELCKKKCPEGVDSASAIIDLCLYMMTQFKNMLQHLRPEVLDGLGLNAALLELINTWKLHNPKVDISLKINNLGDGFNDLVNISLYRIMQESLTNISRHSNADKVNISLDYEYDADVVMRVTDNGKGMGLDDNESFGLSGMRERIKSLGGEFTAGNNSEGGFIVSVIIPHKVCI
jgi:two-component system sensor histidine kinase UhpB